MKNLIKVIDNLLPRLFPLRSSLEERPWLGLVTCPADSAGWNELYLWEGEVEERYLTLRNFTQILEKYISRIWSCFNYYISKTSLQVILLLHHRHKVLDYALSMEQDQISSNVDCSFNSCRCLAKARQQRFTKCYLSGLTVILAVTSRCRLYNSVANPNYSRYLFRDANILRDAEVVYEVVISFTFILNWRFDAAWLA